MRREQVTRRQVMTPDDQAGVSRPRLLATSAQSGWARGLPRSLARHQRGVLAFASKPLDSLASWRGARRPTLQERVSGVAEARRCRSERGVDAMMQGAFFVHRDHSSR